MAAIRNAFSRSSHDDEDTSQYRLQITAGPSYDTSTHSIVNVNTDKATPIENDFIKAEVRVRVRGYRGLPEGAPSSSPYFDDPLHEKDQYSIAFDFIPKQDLPSENAVWGNDFDHPIRDRLPPGTKTACDIVKRFIDPGLEFDPYGDKPSVLGPALSCWFAFRIGEKAKDFANPTSGDGVTREGGDGEGLDIRTRHGLPEDNEKRRKFFLSHTNRQSFTWEQGRRYSADFYNPYLDFGNFALKLPGFSIGVIKYVDDKSHTLRYVFKNKVTGDVYLCVNFNLLWEKQSRGSESAAVSTDDKPSGDASVPEKTVKEPVSNKVVDMGGGSTAVYTE